MSNKYRKKPVVRALHGYCGPRGARERTRATGSTRKTPGFRDEKTSAEFPMIFPTRLPLSALPVRIPQAARDTVKEARLLRELHRNEEALRKAVKERTDAVYAELSRWLRATVPIEGIEDMDEEAFAEAMKAAGYSIAPSRIPGDTANCFRFVLFLGGERIAGLEVTA